MFAENKCTAGNTGKSRTVLLLSNPERGGKIITFHDVELGGADECKCQRDASAAEVENSSSGSVAANRICSRAGICGYSAAQSKIIGDRGKVSGTIGGEYTRFTKRSPSRQSQSGHLISKLSTQAGIGKAAYWRWEVAAATTATSHPECQ